MTPKKYNSFEEIDLELKILKLKRAIDKEHLALNYNKVKYYIYPKNLILEVTNSLKQQLLTLIFERFNLKF